MFLDSVFLFSGHIFNFSIVETDDSFYLLCLLMELGGLLVAPGIFVLGIRFHPLACFLHSNLYFFPEWFDIRHSYAKMLFFPLQGYKLKYHFLRTEIIVHQLFFSWNLGT